MDLMVVCKWLLVFFVGGIVFTILGFIVTSIVGEILLRKYVDGDDSESEGDIAGGGKRC